MSRLACETDDHAEASQKHYDDARALRRASRLDGAGYLAGYVVECSLKAILLHDRAYEPSTGTINEIALQKWHGTLRRKPFGHDLPTLIAAQVGPEGARYFPRLAGSAIVSGWTEAVRYWPEGRIDELKVDNWMSCAESAIESIVRMRLDGVL